jgi:hypothetical protein
MESLLKLAEQNGDAAYAGVDDRESSIAALDDESLVNRVLEAAEQQVER